MKRRRVPRDVAAQPLALLQPRRCCARSCRTRCCRRRPTSVARPNAATSASRPRSTISSRCRCRWSRRARASASSTAAPARASTRSASPPADVEQPMRGAARRRRLRCARRRSRPTELRAAILDAPLDALAICPRASASPTGTWRAPSYRTRATIERAVDRLTARYARTLALRRRASARRRAPSRRGAALPRRRAARARLRLPSFAADAGARAFVTGILGAIKPFDPCRAGSRSMTRKLAVGITCYHTFGGSGIVATEIGLELARRGHRVHFICAEPPARLDPSRRNLSFHQVELRDYPLLLEGQYPLALASQMIDGRRAGAPRPVARALRAAARHQRLPGAADPRPARAARRHHAARHRHHARRQRSVVPADHALLHRAVRRRDRALGVAGASHARQLRHRRAPSR